MLESGGKGHCSLDGQKRHLRERCFEKEDNVRQALKNEWD